MRNLKTSSLLLLLLLALKFNCLFGQVGFNNPNPHSSSILDLTATDKGLLIPRMTSLQRLAITNPANGLLVFDKTLKAFCVYDTVSNPDKWLMVNTMNAEAKGNANITSITTGNIGLGIVNPIKKLEVAGSIRSTDTIMASTIITTGRIIANEFSGNGSVPSGAIIMWYGTTPPAGWLVCDGTNGTPDLRGRFVVGSGTNGNPATGDINPSYSVGATGGENKHLLTKTELPTHKHTVSNILTDNGQVNIGASPTTDTYSAVGADPFFRTGRDVDPQYTNAINQPTHTHTISGTTGDGTTDGLGSTPHENRPPYYVLTYIMKQ